MNYNTLYLVSADVELCKLFGLMLISSSMEYSLYILGRRNKKNADMSHVEAFSLEDMSHHRIDPN
jgi:hypothetical protein